jgi:hypothetical protein
LSLFALMRAQSIFVLDILGAIVYLQVCTRVFQVGERTHVASDNHLLALLLLSHTLPHTYASFLHVLPIRR